MTIVVREALALSVALARELELDFGLETELGLMLELDFELGDVIAAAEAVEAAAALGAEYATADPQPLGIASGKLEKVDTGYLVEGSLVVTYWPGLGNCTLTDAVVSQLPDTLVPRFATNKSGRPAIAVSSEAPPLMSTAAQFMYISRLPTLLNHVQASVA